MCSKLGMLVALIFHKLHSLTLIGWIKLLKENKNAPGLMNVILLHDNYRHVSATHVAIFRVMKTRI